MSLDDPKTIARKLIAEEAERGTGSLDLSGLKLDALTPEIAGLTALRQLSIAQTQVSDLAPLASLTALEELNCAVTRVRDLAPLANLAALQQLNCSGTQVSDLAPLAGLTALRQILCSRTNVSDLAPLSGLTALRRLDSMATEVSDLAPLSGLTGLQQLRFLYTRVRDLAPLAGLTGLQELHCSQTQVSDLAPLAGLNGLKMLRCWQTQVSDLAPLAGLTALEHLNCSNTQVCDLAPLAGLTTLKDLDCSVTEVGDLAPLASLPALESLGCWQTLVRDLAPLAGLTAVRVINCSECRLGALPPAIRDNRSLTLIAFNSHVPGLPHGVLSQSLSEDCLPRVRAHYADMAEGAVDLTDVRLFLLGNGGAGKTQIGRWLSGSEFDPDWDSTHGIRIFSQPKPGSTAARLHLSIWDFGGQDIYHGTHALFLNGPAILMPVWAKDRENRDTYEYGGLTFRNHPLSYWIDVVAHQANPHRPVVIVQNKCDRKEQEERRFPVPQETLDNLRYVTELYLSPKEARGAGTLEDTLQDAILWMRDPNRLGLPKIGAGRLRVQRRLEALREADMALPPAQRRHRLLERSDFDAICAEEGGVTSPAMLLDYLNANGTVFYRPGLFSDRIVLDQSWALEAIYAVFDRKRVYNVLRQRGGRFSRAELGLMVWHDHSDAEQQLLLSMMVSCGICFLHRQFGDADDDSNEYIAPDLLPPRESVAGQLAAWWAEDRPQETATFRYALLHGGLIRSVLAEIGKVAGADALYWRGGLCAYEAGTRSRLLIEEEMTGDWQGVIRVRTQDGAAAELLQKAVEVVERVQSTLGLQPIAVDRSPSGAKPDEPIPMKIVQEKPTVSEWYVSYAWGDDLTPEGRAREAIVDRLCAAAAAKGHKILRDKEVMSLGDSISAFMRRIGSGDRVFVILSDKYLRSAHCMFELSEVWRTSRHEGKAFLERTRMYALPDANIFRPSDWVDWAIYWKQEHDALEARAQQHGIVVLGDTGHRRLTQMRTFYTQVADILGTIADIVQPRTFEDLERHGFGDLP